MVEKITDNYDYFDQEKVVYLYYVIRIYVMKETQNTEFKESWRDEYIKYVSGFANAQGGSLYVGINDKGTVVGLRDAERLIEELPNKISTTTGIAAEVNLLVEGDKEYVSITVQPSMLPISYHGKYYFRSGSTLQELTGIAAQDFIMKKMGISWDSQIVEGATLDDIDPSRNTSPCRGTNSLQMLSIMPVSLKHGGVALKLLRNHSRKKVFKCRLSVKSSKV